MPAICTRDMRLEYEYEADHRDQPEQARPVQASAIRLVEAGFEVTLVEREKFPRHKLCGEFISPECLLHFEDLGVRERNARPRWASILRKHVFYEPWAEALKVSKYMVQRTGGAALSLSRAEIGLQADGTGERPLERTVLEKHER